MSQVQQEMTFQSHLNTRLKTKSTNIEQYYEQLMGKAQADIGSILPNSVFCFWVFSWCEGQGTQGPVLLD